VATKRRCSRCRIPLAEGEGTIFHQRIERGRLVGGEECCDSCRDEDPGYAADYGDYGEEDG
jgi:hypothetical protein